MSDLYARRAFMRLRGRARPTGSLSADDRMLFIKRLALMLRSGMPLNTALEIIRDESRSRSARALFDDVAARVSRGLSLAASLKAHRSFSAYAVGIVRAGEASGTLHQNLEYLAEELKRSRALRRKLCGAFIYPAILIAATLCITLVLTVYIFPKIVPVFQSVRVSLPWSTRALMAVSAFLVRRGLVVLAGVFLCAISARACYARSPRFRMSADAAMLRVPLFGMMIRDHNVATICRTLSILIKSDVEITASVDMIADAIDNRAYRRELSRIREGIARGMAISSQMKSAPRLFPPLMVQMIAAGESTGSLETALSYAADHYEEEIDARARDIATLLEPVMMLFMGVIVGFIAISIILPIYGMTEAITPKGV